MGRQPPLFVEVEHAVLLLIFCNFASAVGQCAPEDRTDHALVVQESRNIGCFIEEVGLLICARLEHLLLEILPLLRFLDLYEATLILVDHIIRENDWHQSRLECGILLRLKLRSGGPRRSEVTQEDAAVVTHQPVAWLDISMHQVVRVEEFQCA